MKNTIQAGMAARFRYPGLFNLEYGKYYHFTNAEKNACILLNQCEKGVKTVDNKNSIASMNDSAAKIEPVECYELKMQPEFKEGDYEGRTIEELKVLISEYQNKEVFCLENYYSELLVFVEYKKFNVEHYEANQKRYINATYKALHKFISKYNLISRHNIIIDYISEEKSGNISYVLRAGYFLIPEGQSFEQHITNVQVWNFSRKSFAIENLGLHGIKELRDSTINEYTTELLSSLQTELTQEERFLSNAWQQLALSNYKYAYLEAFFAIETAVEKFLLHSKKRIGIPQKFISDFSGDTGIAYQINIEIPMVLGGIDKNHVEFIEVLNKIRKTRNNIVHRGDDVPEEDVKYAIDIIGQYVRFLNGIIAAS